MPCLIDVPVRPAFAESGVDLGERENGGERLGGEETAVGMQSMRE